MANASKQARYDQYKSKVIVFNRSKNKPKPKIRYGVFAEKFQCGYKKNGLWHHV